MTRARTYFCFVFLCGALCVSAQNTNELSIIVNKPAEDSNRALQASDISILEDGVEQSISSFRNDQEQSNLSTVVILLDAQPFGPRVGGLGSSPIPATADTEPIKKAAANALQAFAGNASVAFYSARNELHVLRDIPQSAAASRTELSASDLKSALQIFDHPRNPLPEAKVVFNLPAIKRFDLAALESIASHVADRPGRKALVWFCDESPIRFSPEEGPLYYSWFSAMNALQHANMAVYPINCLEFSSGGMDKPLRQLAEWTGGRSYNEYTDLNNAIEQALTDSHPYYTAVWKPAHVPVTPIHSIRIRSKTPLLYPHAIVEPVVPSKEAQRLFVAEAGLATPLSAHAMRLAATLQKENGGVVAKLSIDPHSVTLEENNGVHRGALDVIYAYYDAAGNRMNAGSHDTMVLNIKSSDLTDFLSHATAVNQPLVIPPGAVSVRILIRDANSGALGSQGLSLE